MTFSVSAPAFEGPLGLLLDLAEKGKVELTAISVSSITADYLKRVSVMGDLEPEELSDFLRLGSRLLYIKSLALLPRGAAEEQAEELQRLTLELAEYRRYQQAARTLSGRLGAQTWPRNAVTKLPTEELPLPDLSLTVLQEAFSRALKRAVPLSGDSTLDQEMTQDEVMEQLKHRLESGGFALSLVLDTIGNRYEIILTFMALLELLKSGEAIVTQAGQFGPITIEVAHARA